MIRIHTIEGTGKIYFELTVELNKIKEGGIGTVVSPFVRKTVRTWASGRYHSTPKKPTVKNCFYEKLPFFDDGKDIDVLLIRGEIYEMSDETASKMLKELQNFLIKNCKGRRSAK